MSNKKNTTPKPPIPKMTYVAALGSLFLFYKSFNRFWERDYDAGMFLVFAGVIMLFGSYSFYRGSRY